MSEPAEDSRKGLVIVARAARTRGLKGELAADLLTDFPERFEQLSKLSGVGPKGELQELELESYWFQGDRVVLKFSGYDSIESAEALVGFEFGVPEEERVQLSNDEFYDWELEGCQVQTQEGVEIGKVREVLRTGAVELLVIENEEKREILIPMNQSIVSDIDIASKKIRVDPPDGLLDL